MREADNEHTRSWARLAGWCALALALGACVDGVPKDHIGSAAFNQASATLDTDYGGSSAAPMTTAGTGATVPIAPSGSGGAGVAAPAIAGSGGMIGTGATAGVGNSGTGGMGGMGGSKSGSGGTAGSAGMAGSASMAGSTGMAGTGMTSTGSGSAGMLTIHFTSINQGGRYAPANVGAVWIEDGSGKFIKTIKRWGTIRATHLTAWADASGGWPNLFFGGGNAADQMDAISTATERNHGARDMDWDMKDPAGMLVPDGKYKVRIEITEDNFAPGANASAEFTKGPMPDMEKPADQAPWSGLTLSYQP